MSERSLRATELISILLLFVQVSETLKMTLSIRGLIEGDREGRRLTLEESSKSIERLKKELSELDYDAKHPAISGYTDHRNQHEVASLQKVLRSVEDDEQEDFQVRDIESALTSIERETAYHENRKRSKIAKVLASVDQHTNQAMAQNLTSSEDTKEPNADKTVISLPNAGAGIRNKEGRTIHLKTNIGNKRVFIPRGWMFCTLQPPKCFSKRKKRYITKGSVSMGNLLVAKHIKMK
ncbi:uncharacterized protein [Montipora foliosa]|uniref:uncharacterized protein n=1 Tax=Montipora foliosa TaxID=591990 RepID=UPI0035F11031